MSKFVWTDGDFEFTPAGEGNMTFPPSQAYHAVWEEIDAELDREAEQFGAWLARTFGGDPDAPPPLPAQLPSREDLLQVLAERLLWEAQTALPRVLQIGVGAEPHPVEHFMVAQLREQGDDPAQWTTARFQLPEPLLGPIGPETRVLTVGLNPAYSEEEVIPRFGTSQDEYVAWYARRFGPEGRDTNGVPIAHFPDGPHVVPHYRAIERDYLDDVLSEQALGRTAVHADALPWKWNRERNPKLTGDVIRYARARIALIAAVLRPRVVLTLGDFAADVLGLPHPTLIPEPVRGMGAWSGMCLPVFHPNRRLKTGQKQEHVEAAREHMRRLLA